MPHLIRSLVQGSCFSSAPSFCRLLPCRRAGSSSPTAEEDAEEDAARDRVKYNARSSKTGGTIEGHRH